MRKTRVNSKNYFWISTKGTERLFMERGVGADLEQPYHVLGQGQGGAESEREKREWA